MTPEEVKVLKRKRVLKLQLIELTNKEIEELDRLIEEEERQKPKKTATAQWMAELTNEKNWKGGKKDANISSERSNIGGGEIS